MDVRALLEVKPRELADTVVDHARRVTGRRAGLYFVDIQGDGCRRLAGDATLPAFIAVRGAVGSEIDAAAVADLERHVREVLPGARVAPLFLHGRAKAVLLTDGGPLAVLEEFALAAAPAFAIASQFTDTIHRARRGHHTTPAAEAQQDLLAPRMAHVAGGELAASVLPAYGVGGDWFDHADNPEGTWLAVADAMGKGIPATAVSVIGLAALRAGRRGGDDLETCCRRMNRAVGDLHGDGYLTAVVAFWHAPTSTFSWISCGHPSPILIGAGGEVEELAGAHGRPLGLWPDDHDFTRNARRLHSGDRVLLCSDGITELRTSAGWLGEEQLMAILAELGTATAAETVAALEEFVASRGREGFSDDATQLVLAVG